jgi:O-antigen/teichoic acid export membrane protein
LLIKPFWFFGIEVSVQNAVDNEQYGLYFSLLNFTIIFNILLDIGITNFNNREIAQHNNLISKYFSNIIGAKILLGLAYSLVCFIVAILIGYNEIQIHLLLFLIINQIFASFILYLRSNINGLLMFVTDSIFSVMDKVLMILLCGFLLWSGCFGVFRIQWFVYAQTISYLITAIIAFIVVYRKCDFFYFRFNLKYIIVIFKRSYPFALLVLLMSLYNRIDSVLLERLLPDGKEQAGMYAQAYRILDLCSNYALLFPVLLLPLFSKLLKQKQNINTLVKLSTLLLIIPSIILIVICLMYNNEILKLLYHGLYNEVAFSMLMIGFIGICFTYIFGTLLTANGSLRALNMIAFISLILNMTLNLILIPHYKATGAALAGMITQLISAIVQVIIVIKVFHLNVNRVLIFKGLAFLVFTLSLGYFLKSLYLEPLKGIAILIVFAISMAIVLRLLKPKELMEFLKKD